jgi:flagellar biosynthesis/type III secretory pathway protein FliH
VASAHAQGVAEGEARAIAGAARALEAAVEAFAAAAVEREQALARDAIELALVVARRILRKEVDAGRYDIERIVRETLAASGAGRGACVVHLHPDDLAALQGVPFRAGTELQADHEVARGEVHVTTARGTIVRDIDAALASIATRLAEEAA